MKILLAAINARYNQTSLAIRVLRAWCEAHVGAVRSGTLSFQTEEWNINQPVQAVIRGVFESGADAVFFSTYIWNRDMVIACASGIRSVMPDILIGLGGPEVSWSAGQTFADCPDADLIVAGEGEETLAEISAVLERRTSGPAPDDTKSFDGKASRTSGLEGIRGVYTRKGFGGARNPLADLSAIPFPYGPERLDFSPENRIVYYESSRGCPYSCAYCLSSLDKSVRYYPLDRVLQEIGYFMDRGFPLVKFVDRTFNLDPARYLAIWRYIRDHHNGKTLFHFEIAAELLGDEAFETLSSMPEGAIQFEIGIQSTNPDTLSAVGRKSDLALLAERIARIPPSIHTHVDLIAGLPLEGLESFGRSFDYAFSLDVGMVQLGFLKVLSGSPMETMARSLPGYIWSRSPPYEVLGTPVLPYADLLLLKDVEQVLDTWYNSGLMRNTLRFLAKNGSPSGSAFSLFRRLASFIREWYPDGDLFQPRRPADSFACMAAWLASADGPEGFAGLEWLKFDFLLQGKPGSFPPWYHRSYSKDAHDRALGVCLGSGTGDRPESRRTRYARSEYDEFLVGPDGDREAFLFVYAERSGHREKEKVKVFRV